MLLPPLHFTVIIIIIWNDKNLGSKFSLYAEGPCSLASHSVKLCITLSLWNFVAVSKPSYFHRWDSYVKAVSVDCSLSLTEAVLCVCHVIGVQSSCLYAEKQYLRERRAENLTLVTAIIPKEWPIRAITNAMGWRSGAWAYTIHLLYWHLKRGVFT